MAQIHELVAKRAQLSLQLQGMMTARSHKFFVEDSIAESDRFLRGLNPSVKVEIALSIVAQDITMLEKLIEKGKA